MSRRDIISVETDITIELRSSGTPYGAPTVRMCSDHMDCYQYDIPTGYPGKRLHKLFVKKTYRSLSRRDIISVETDITIKMRSVGTPYGAPTGRISVVYFEYCYQHNIPTGYPG